MANNVVAGAKNPEGFSGFRKWLDPRVLVPVLVVLAFVALLRPTSVPSPHAASLSAADVTSIVATTPQPVAKTPVPPTAAPMPTMPPTPPQQLAVNDVSSQPAPPPPPPTAPPTISPAVLARQERAAEDHAALDGPIVVVAISPSPEASRVPKTDAQDELWLRPGMSISATLYTSITSGLPGLIVAYLKENLYDSTHKHLVAPSGAKLIGKYGSGGSFTISQNQTHLPASFSEIQLDDRVIALGDQPGIDPTGTSGLGATVDHHTKAAIENLILLTAIGALLNHGGTSCANCGVSYGSNSSGVGGAVIQAGSQMLPHSGQDQPTLHIAEAADISVMVTSDIRVEEWKP